MNPEQNVPVPNPLASVAASPVAAQPAAAPTPAAAPRGRWKVAVAATAVAVLAAAGAGYAWAYRGAETVVPEAFRMAGEADTVRAEAEADFSVDVSGYEVEASMSLDGAVDQTDPLHPKMDFRFQAEFDGMRGEGALRFVDENLYFQVSQIPGLAIAGAEGVEEFVGQWFFVSAAEMETTSGQSLAELFAQAEANRARADENFDRLFSSGTFSFGPAKVFSADGELVREYAVDLDSAALADFAVAEMNRLATTTEAREAIAEAEPVVRAILPGISLEEGSVRVALLSGELREIRGTLLVDFDAMDQEALGGDDAAVGAEIGADLACEIGPDGSPSVGCYAADPEPAEPLSGSVRVKFAARYSGFGEPVEIEAPAGAVSISDAFGYGAYDAGFTEVEGDQFGADAELIEAGNYGGQFEVDLAPVEVR